MRIISASHSIVTFRILKDCDSTFGIPPICKILIDIVFCCPASIQCHARLFKQTRLTSAYRFLVSLPPDIAPIGICGVYYGINLRKWEHFRKTRSF